MRSFTVLSALTVTVLTVAACHVSIDRSIYIENGETVRHSLNVIDGDIVIGSNCDIRGTCRTIDGNIEVGHSSRVRGLQLVDGDITVGRDVAVRRDVELVDGEILCYPGVEIRGDVGAIDGSITLERTIVEQDIVTYAADISLLRRSTVHGDIIVKRSGDDHSTTRRLRIEVTGGSVVKGDIIVRDDDIEVTVYIIQGGRVEGRIRNAEVVRR